MKANFRSYAWAVLIFHLAVVVWGAFVRASDSGAGCGEHWPLCNGQVVPKAPLPATMIEFGHRVTSGLAFVSVLVLFIWAWSVFKKGHAVRRAALLAMMSTVVECLIGAALVLLHLVKANASLSHGLWLSAHLVNTLLLLAALSSTAWLATTIDRPSVRYQKLAWSRLAVGLSIAAFLTAAVLGGFAAVGDSLATSRSLFESIRADFSPFSNIFVRLRILHPIVAGGVAIYLLVIALRVSASLTTAIVKRFSATIGALVILQCSVGIANIALKTPTWLQLLHLLAADLLWIALVLFTLELLPSVRRVRANNFAGLRIDHEKNHSAVSQSPTKLLNRISYRT